MSEPITVTVTSLSPDTVKVDGSSSQTVEILNGGAVNVAVGTVSPGNATIVSGTLTINSTTTLAAGQSAYVKNDAGTAYAAKLDIGIPAGPATLVTVGNTTTLAAGSNATVSGTTNGGNLTLAFSIPRGADGTNGTNGSSGINGITPTFTASASTLSAGSNATVTATTSNSGANVALAFGIPTGAAGSSGSNLTLSDATPSALGTAAAGTSATASRSDHTHALPVIAYGNLSGVPANFPTNTTLVSGLSDGYSAINHAHNYVTSLNNLTGALTLAAGSNVTLTTNGSTLTLSSSAGGLGANDAVDGGDYVGEILYGITFGTQPQSQTVTAVGQLGSWGSYTAPQPQTTFSIGSTTYDTPMSSGAVGLISNGSAFGTVYAILARKPGPQTQGGSSTVNGVTTPLYYYGTYAIEAGIATSSDASSWGQINYTPIWENNLYYPDLFVAPAFYGSSDGTNFIVCTQNKVLWYSQSSGWASTGIASPNAMGSVAFGNGIYVLPQASNGNIFPRRSTDLSNWSADYVNVQTRSGLSITSVAATYGLNKFFTAAKSSTGKVLVLSSSDAVTWVESLYADSSAVAAIAASSSRVVVVTGTSSVAVTSNGTSWTTATTPRTVMSIAWANDRFIGMDSANSTYEYVYSFDGLTWNVGSVGASGYYSSAAGNGSYLLIGSRAASVNAGLPLVADRIAAGRGGGHGEVGRCG